MLTTHEPAQPTAEEEEKKVEDHDYSNKNATHQSLLAVKFLRFREFNSDSDEDPRSDAKNQIHSKELSKMMGLLANGCASIPGRKRTKNTTGCTEDEKGSR